MRGTSRGGRRGRHAATGRLSAVVVVAALVLGACGDDDADADADAEDPVAVAEARVAQAQGQVSEAQTAFDEAGAAFCEGSEDYIRAIDRYAKVFDQEAATVGDVTTAGADLAEPREAVRSSADAVVAARDGLAQANQELADAEVALAAAQSPASGPSASSTTTTTAPLLPPGTVDRVEQAESDLAAATEGITDETPLTEATAEFNAAAFSLQVAWLRLFADAGCLTDEQLVAAQAAVGEYTVALQTSLQVAGFYEGEIDGVYGPATVEAVKTLQTETGLPVTGLVDQATAAALTSAVAATGAEAAAQAQAHTTAVQSTLKLAGYWTGPVDGQWTPELTTALSAFQTALGVPPTGVVDAATLAALQQTIAEAQTAATSTTTTVAPTAPTVSTTIATAPTASTTTTP